MEMFKKQISHKNRRRILFCLIILFSCVSLFEHTFFFIFFVNRGLVSGSFEQMNAVFGEVEDYSVKSLKQEANKVILGFLAKHFSKRRIHGLRVSHTTPISTHSLHFITTSQDTIAQFQCFNNPRLGDFELNTDI